MTNLDTILQSRDITLPTKVHLVKAMVFPVVTYGCESWTIKKAECRRIDAFKPWCWRRLLRVPWTARRSNQSILKKISPGCSLVRLMLKLKLQYYGHLMQRADSLENTLMLGKIEGITRRGWQRARWLDGITDSMDMSLTTSGRWWRTGKPGVLQSMRLQRIGHDWATEQQEEQEGGPALHLFVSSLISFFSVLQCSAYRPFASLGRFILRCFILLVAVVNGLYMKTQKTLNSQSSLEKEEQSWRNQPSWLQIILQSYSHQDSMVLAQKQKCRQMEQDRKPRKKPMHLWVPYFWQRRQEYTVRQRQPLQ